MSMEWKPGTGRLRFVVSLFLIYLSLVTFFGFFYLAVDRGQINQIIAVNLVLLIGLLLSLAAGLFAWAMGSRKNYLELEIKRKTEDAVQKNYEVKKAEITAAAIYQSCRTLFSETEFDSLLHKVMHLASKVLFADEGSLMLLDSNRELYIAASKGIPNEIACGVHIKIGQRVVGRAAQERRDLLIVDGLDKYPEFAGIEANPRVCSSIICPLICQNELLGVLSLSRTTTRENFTVADMINVSIFASQVAQAIRNVYLYRALEDKIAELQETNRRLKLLQEQIP